MSGKDVTPTRESFVLDFYWLLAGSYRFLLDFNNFLVALTCSGCFWHNP